MDDFKFKFEKFPFLGSFVRMDWRISEWSVSARGAV
jgi:hypothetical protein